VASGVNTPRRTEGFTDASSCQTQCEGNERHKEGLDPLFSEDSVADSPGRKAMGNGGAVMEDCRG